MKHETQIDLIELFFSNSEKNLLVCSPTEEIELFYFSVLKHFSKNKFNLLNATNIEDGVAIDFFSNNNLKCFYSKSADKISNFVNIDEKKIIFTDYKSFKKYKSVCASINGYLYEKDIEILITKKFLINNKDLIFFCKNEPALCFAEIQKFKINNKNYSADSVLKNQQNFILDIRSSFYNLKTNRKIKDLYEIIKKEAEYKKFNFLTY